MRVALARRDGDPPFQEAIGQDARRAVDASLLANREEPPVLVVRLGLDHAAAVGRPVLLEASISARFVGSKTAATAGPVPESQLPKHHVPLHGAPGTGRI